MLAILSAGEYQQVFLIGIYVAAITICILTF